MDQNVDDFLRLVLISCAGVRFHLSSLQYFTDSVHKTGTLDFAEFIRRFNVWYSPLEREADACSRSGREWNPQDVDDVQIVIPAMSLEALSLMLGEHSSVKHDTRWMIALLPLEEVTGPGFRIEIFEELMTRFITHHVLLHPMAHSVISNGDSGTTWGDLCDGRLFGKSAFLRDLPISTMYQAGRPFPCFGFKNSIKQIWEDCKKACPMPSQFWDKIVNTSLNDASSMYEHALSTQGVENDRSEWVVFRPRPLSEGPDSIMMARKPGEDGMHNSIQMQIRLWKMEDEDKNRMTWEMLKDEVVKIMLVTPKNWRTTLLFFWTNISEDMKKHFGQDNVMYMAGEDVPGVPKEYASNVELIVLSLDGIHNAFPDIKEPLEKLLNMSSASRILHQETADWILQDASFGRQGGGVESSK